MANPNCRSVFAALLCFGQALASALSDIVNDRECVVMKAFALFLVIAYLTGQVSARVEQKMKVQKVVCY